MPADEAVAAAARERGEPRSTEELERLVAETQALLAQHSADLDLALEWSGKPTDPGEREARRI